MQDAIETIDWVERRLSCREEGFSRVNVHLCRLLRFDRRSGRRAHRVPPIDDDDDLNRLLDLVDGMVLVGGADLDPRRDGYMLHPSVRTLDVRREEFDRG